MLDFILNGKPYGDVAHTLLAAGGDPLALRPFRGEDGQSYITKNVSGVEQAIVTNAPSSLTFEDWRFIDDTVERIAKPRLGAIGDLRSRNLERKIPNGMGYTVFSYKNMSDISPAQINMNPIVKTDTDRPVFDIENIPLPIIHKDFSFNLRELMASRNGNSPLDTTTLELATERVAEGAENLLLGTWQDYSFAGGTVYGYLNYPYRLTKTLTAPSALGWTPSTLINEMLIMRQMLSDKFKRGPYILYLSPNWDIYLDADFSGAKGDLTLRERLRKITGIADVQTLEYLQYATGNPYTALLVQMQSTTIQLLVGMEIMTVQWESHGGMQFNFKVMCLMVPLLRRDQNGNVGICHGSAAS